VLDLGCGSSSSARYLRTRHGLCVTGIDLLSEHLSESPGDRVIPRVRGDYHFLPIRDQVLDGVYSMETIVHSPSPEEVCAEVFRVLRPGGRISLFEYSSTPLDQLRPRSRKALTRVADLAAMPGLLIMTHGRLLHILSDLGFEDVKSEDISERIMPMLRTFHHLGFLPYLVARILHRTSAATNSMSGVEMYRHPETWRYQIVTATRPA
ncbi:MAG: Methyltransferase type 11, partial [Ilumatobacteraceae bacterium]|nr:Methyltransferase type 11 [Ilumatobacteraceae bacterium]